jgi:hypothetical protein
VRPYYKLSYILRNEGRKPSTFELSGFRVIFLVHVLSELSACFCFALQQIAPPLLPDATQKASLVVEVVAVVGGRARTNRMMEKKKKKKNSSSCHGMHSCTFRVGMQSNAVINCS